MTSVRRRLVVTTAVVAGFAAAAGCGVPYSSEFDPVSSDEIPFDIAATTSTSTTTTTTIAPTTSEVLESTSTTIGETTTTIATESVNVVFILGSQLQIVPRPLAAPASLAQVMAAIVAGPPEDDAFVGFRSVFPEGVEVPTVDENGGVAEVNLPGELLEEVTPRDQRLLFGQIVLTLTRRPGVGQVRFLVDGEERGVFRGDGSQSRPGELLLHADYVELLADFTTPATTSTSTTTVTTVADTDPESPPDDEAADGSAPGS